MFLCVEPLSTHIQRKMAAGLLLLVCAGAVLYSAQAQDLYNQLPDSYKKGVDLAVEQLNSHAGVHHHFRFLRSLEKSDIEVNLRVFFLSVLGLKNFGVYLCLSFLCENLVFWLLQ